jgi:hypothetical protein
MPGKRKIQKTLHEMKILSLRRPWISGKWQPSAKAGKNKRA